MEALLKNDQIIDPVTQVITAQVTIHGGPYGSQLTEQKKIDAMKNPEKCLNHEFVNIFGTCKFHNRK